ncbi:MAG: HDIG domain-containing protein [Candidatus Thermoplasmatota archaeon]|nr:HDIG domain-containing protein [Candidatus Thermoplasmatota archaeon]
MIDRTEALSLLHQYLQNEKLIFHCLAVEAIMQKIASHLHKDIELWGLTGLLHDLDYEYTEKNPEKHATITAELIDGILPSESIHAIKAHNYIHTGYLPTSKIDKALISADAVSGLIIASALVMPHKKLSEVKPKTVTKKFSDKSFAKGCDRDRILLCEDIEISLEEFLKISLTALQEIASEIKL